MHPCSQQAPSGDHSITEDHKKYIVWAQGCNISARWYIAVETDDWDEAIRAFKDKLLSRDTGDAIITEFIPLAISNGRKTSTPLLQGAHLIKLAQERITVTPQAPMRELKNWSVGSAER